MNTTETVRVFRYALDTNPATNSILERNAGAARWAFNHAHAQLLTQWQAFDARKQATAQHLSGLDRDAILDQLTKTDRKKLYTQARQAVTRENTQRRNDSLKALDEHRSRVTHKGRPALDPGPAPTEDATDLERTLYQRRCDLAALQASNPTAYTTERKKELADVRPRVLKLKQQLAADGAYRPGAFDIAAWWRTTRDLPKEEGGSPWWTDVAVGAILCGFDRADAAWKNWMSSASGTRAGRRMGQPRFKKKGKAKDSFALPNTSRAVIHLDTPRRLRISGVGEFRLAAHGKRLWRLLNRGHAEITSITISRGGHRWYASIVCKVQQVIPTKPTPRQRAAGLVAADLGSQPLAVLSAPLNPADPGSAAIASMKPWHAEESRLVRAQRTLSRTKRGSKNRRKAARHVGKIHHIVAERRASYLHGVSKQLATGAHYIAIEDLDLLGLTASAKGSVDAPGTDVQIKSRFNRHLLDNGLGELRRQLTYKTSWYGSRLIVLDRGEPTASKCSKCGERNPSSKPSDKHFTCPRCGLDVNRRTNSVRNIYKAARRQITASVAPGTGETQNALRGEDQPPTGDGSGPPPLTSTPPP